MGKWQHRLEPLDSVTATGDGPTADGLGVYYAPRNRSGPPAKFRHQPVMAQSISASKISGFGMHGEFLLLDSSAFCGVFSFAPHLLHLYVLLVNPSTLLGDGCEEGSHCNFSRNQRGVRDGRCIICDVKRPIGTRSRLWGCKNSRSMLRPLRHIASD